MTVGTDHHPFDRLVEWVDAWCRDHPEADVVVQYGTSRPPRHAVGHALLDAREFADTMAAADAVVCAGGPGVIMEARALGIRPIVVPRVAARGEHVDDHQGAFAAFMAERGAVVLVDRSDELAAALDAVAHDPGIHRIDPEDGGSGGIARIGTLIDELLGGRRR